MEALAQLPTTDEYMSSAMKNRDNPFGWTTTVIICKRWFKNQVKHYLYTLLVTVDKKATLI